MTTTAAPDPFHALADPTRRALLDRLRHGEATAGELAAGFEVSRPAISRHLRVLRMARLVRERRGGEDGRERVYTLIPDPLREVARWALTYQAFWDRQLAGLQRHLRTAAHDTASPPHRP